MCVGLYVYCVWRHNLGERHAYIQNTHILMKIYTHICSTENRDQVGLLLSNMFPLSPPWRTLFLFLAFLGTTPHPFNPPPLESRSTLYLSLELGHAQATHLCKVVPLPLLGNGRYLENQPEMRICCLYRRARRTTSRVATKCWPKALAILSGSLCCSFSLEFSFHFLHSWLLLFD